MKAYNTFMIEILENNHKIQNKITRISKSRFVFHKNNIYDEKKSLKFN
jgi:hypothetical protein